MRWEDCQRAFYIDGSLRDIYIFQTSTDDWEKLLSFALALDQVIYYRIDGEIASLPKRATSIFNNREHTHTMSIDLTGVIVNCHFFMIEEIELDIDPREIKSQNELDIVIKFIKELGKCLKKDAIVTEENSPNDIWFKYISDEDKITFQIPN